jgi:hypothetical protein
VNRFFGWGAVAAVSLGLASTPARAWDNLGDFLKQTSTSGNIRAYDFNRVYSHKTQGVTPSQSAFSLGGRLDAQTAPFLGGFSVGVGFLTAHSLGANDRDDNLTHLDQTLAGGRTSITALGQAYLQYKNPWLTVKAGDQNINTPWINDSDSRMLPATYQGLYADLTPLDHLHLIGLRIFRWKSRTSTDYFQNNLYYAPSYAGDDMQGGAKTGLAGPDTQGAAAFGATYADHGVKLGLWYYSYQQFANMLYNDTVYTLKTGTGYDPFIGDQFARQWKSDSLLNGAAVNTVKGQTVDNLSYGGKLGLNSPYGQIFVAYLAIADHPGTVGNGALVSPYTIGYTTDPLDTSSMIRGMVDLGPGQAWRVKYSGRFFQEQLAVIGAFARYHSDTYGGSNDALLDLGWYPLGALKGFSVRNRCELAVAGSATGLNPGKSRYFVYNRVQLQYEF